MEIDLPKWYVVRTMVNQEFRIKEFLDNMGIESYLPTHAVIRELCNRRRIVEVPIIRGLVFVHTDARKALSLVKEGGMRARYIYDYSKRAMLTVPDKQMQDFMFLVDHSKKEEISVMDAGFAPGDRVRVVEGDLTGLEGELIRIQGKTHVLVRISQIAAVSVKIARTNLTRIKS